MTQNSVDEASILTVSAILDPLREGSFELRSWSEARVFVCLEPPIHIMLTFVGRDTSWLPCTVIGELSPTLNIPRRGDWIISRKQSDRIAFDACSLASSILCGLMPLKGVLLLAPTRKVLTASVFKTVSQPYYWLLGV